MKRDLPPDPPGSLVAYELAPGQVLFVQELPSIPKIDALTESEQDVLELLLNNYDTATRQKMKHVELSERFLTMATEVEKGFTVLGQPNWPGIVVFHVAGDCQFDDRKHVAILRLLAGPDALHQVELSHRNDAALRELGHAAFSAACPPTSSATPFSIQ